MPVLSSMRKYNLITILLISLTQFACSSQKTDNVHWRGQNYKEVLSIFLLPNRLQEMIGVGRQGLEGIADRNEKFNVTDVIDPTLPMRRFAVAGLSSKSAIVAVERGGRGYNVQILLIPLKSAGEEISETWVLFKKPTTLRALLDELGKLGQE